MYSTSLFLKNQREMSTALGVFDFFHLGYLEDEEYTFPKTCTDRLKRTIIRDMRQINFNTFLGVIKNCRHTMHILLARKDSS